MKCTPKNDTKKENFLQVFTILTNKYNLQALLLIDQGLVISVKDLHFDFNIEKIINSQIGNIPTGFFTFVIQILQPLLVSLLRLVLNNVSIPLGFIINNLLGINWLNFQKSVLHYYNEYFILFTSPQFDLNGVEAYQGEIKFFNDSIREYLK